MVASLFFHPNSGQFRASTICSMGIDCSPIVLSFQSNLIAYTKRLLPRLKLQPSKWAPATNLYPWDASRKFWTHLSFCCRGLELDSKTQEYKHISHNPNCVLINFSAECLLIETAKTDYDQDCLSVAKNSVRESQNYSVKIQFSYKQSP